MTSTSSWATRSGSADGEVDLVDDGDDREVLLERHVDVGQRLRLDPLRGVHDEQGALAGRQRPRDLVGEVHVAGGIDEVELVSPSPPSPLSRERGRGGDRGLRRSTPAASAVRGVQSMRTAVALIVMPRSRSRSIWSSTCSRHLARRDGAGDLKQPVGERALPMVDMGDDAEVADAGLVHAERYGSRRGLEARSTRGEVRDARLTKA